MARKYGLFKKISKAIVGTGLSALLAVTPAYSQSYKPAEKTLMANTTVDMPVETIDKSVEKEQEKDYLNGIITTSFHTADVSPSGGITEEFVNNCFANLQIGNLSLFSWSLYYFDDNRLHEVDLGFSYDFPIINAFKGDISGRIGFENWDYHPRFGSHDNVIKLGVHYSGPIEGDFSFTHLLAHEGNDSGERYIAKIQKSFNLFEKGGVKGTINASAMSAYLDNFYGNDGLGHITPGLEFILQKGPYSVGLSVKQQFGSKDFPDKTYGSIEFGYSF